MSVYSEVEKYITNIPKFATSNQFETNRSFYEFLGKPGNACKIVHVAGTNGKGSVSTYLESILLNHGHSVGLFTSPHLITMRERIRIDRNDISEEEFVECFNKLANKVNEFSLSHGEYQPNFFEILFYMAMLWFDKQRVDYIILETGLGGRLDATNLVDKKALCIITKIAFDHMEYLGDTLEKIALEKAGIMQEKVPVVFYDYSLNVTNVLENEAKAKDCSVSKINKYMANDIRRHENFIDFSYVFKYYGKCDVRLKTFGQYQIVNAMLSICGAEILLDKTLNVEYTCRGVIECSWPCRMEKVTDNVYIDGAHNPDGIEALLESVRELQGRKMLLFAVVKDKDYLEMIELITKANLFDEIVITQIEGERKTEVKEITMKFVEGVSKYSDNSIRVSGIGSYKKAYDYCYKNTDEKTLIIAGSLYLAGLIRKYAKEKL